MEGKLIGVRRLSSAHPTAQVGVQRWPATATAPRLVLRWGARWCQWSYAVGSATRPAAARRSLADQHTSAELGDGAAGVCTDAGRYGLPQWPLATVLTGA